MLSFNYDTIDFSTLRHTYEKGKLVTYLMQNFCKATSIPQLAGAQNAISDTDKFVHKDMDWTSQLLHQCIFGNFASYQ